MTIVDIISVAFGVTGVACACWFYSELWKWAKQCQGARIAVAYKRKVVLDAPIKDYLIWTNQLDQDKHSNGRTIYANGGTRIALIKRAPRKVHKTNGRPAKLQQGNPRMREGVWKATNDTKQPAKQVKDA